MSRQCSIAVLVVSAYFLVTSMVWVVILSPGTSVDVPGRFYSRVRKLRSFPFVGRSCGLESSENVHSPTYTYRCTKPQSPVAGKSTLPPLGADDSASG